MKNESHAYCRVRELLHRPTHHLVEPTAGHDVGMRQVQRTLPLRLRTLLGDAQDFDLVHVLGRVDRPQVPLDRRRVLRLGDCIVNGARCKSAP